MTTIEDILAKHHDHHLMIDMPEWDCQIRVESITGMQRAALEAMWSRGQPSPETFRIELLSMSLKNDDRTAFATKDQIRRLLETKDAYCTERLVDAALKASGISEAEQDAMVGNSSGSPR